jgi:hypothetical protein
VSSAAVVPAALLLGLREFRGAARRGRNADADVRFLKRVTMTARPVGDQEYQLCQQPPDEAGAATAFRRPANGHLESSERTILTIQRILHVSPKPRFVSSVS